tara:strand:- start:119 stop:541 length:423 start_codon:yes stop_codon:yes gene_type:complete
MNTIKKNDLEVGKKSEESMITKFNSVFGELQFTGKFDNFDYYNDDFYVELKTRNIRHNQFQTLFFSDKKYLKGLEFIKLNKRVVFIWKCKDGCFFWELKNDNHETEGFLAVGGRTDRGKNERYMLFNVKTKFIKPLDDFI